MRHHLNRAAVGAAGVSTAVAFIETFNAQAATGNVTCSFAGKTFVSGDIGIMFLASDDEDTSFGVTGWTNISENTDSGACQHDIWTRTMDGTETEGVTTNANLFAGGNMCVLFYSGALEPTGSNVAVSTAETLNCPVSSISATQNVDYVLAASMSSSNSAAVTAPPTGFTLRVDEQYDAGAAEGKIYVSDKNDSATGTVNPSAMTGTQGIGSANHTLTVVLKQG
jgi:hypothetical protein